MVDRHLAACSRRGIAPGLEPAPGVPGFTISPKTTVHYKDGKVVEEWRRLSPERETLEAWVESLEDRVRGKAPVVSTPPVTVNGDLLLEIPIPDHHLGMLSWHPETGADYDCQIASDLLVAGVDSVLAEMPTVQKVALVITGDYYHADTRQPLTERSGNILDTDSRFARRIDMGIEAACQCVEMAATKAAQVEIIVMSGNHDFHSAKWLARILAAYYMKHEHILVRTDPAPQQYLQHGRVLLAYIHGDTMKVKKFATLVPAAQPALWAATDFRYGRVAHWHHRSVEEYPGIVVETLPTMAAPDAYAVEAGYLSRRAITAFLWSARWGLRARIERSVEEIEAWRKQTTPAS